MHVDTRFHFSEKEVLRSGTAGSRVGVCLTLLEIARVFFSVVGPFYIPTSNKEVFIHLNVLDTIAGTVSCLNIAFQMGVW